MNKRDKTNKVFVSWIIFFLFFAVGVYAQPGHDAGEATEGFWLWNFLGHLHPLAVHFPVGLLLFAAVLELFTIKRFHSPLRTGIRVCITVGVASAVVAAVFGLLLARHGDYAGDTFTIHLWAGIATAILGALTLFLLSRIKHHHVTQSVKAYRTVLFFSAVSISVTGHYGASLTHGNDYLASTLPWSKQYNEDKNLVKIDFASFSDDTVQLGPEQQSSLELQVRSIFAHNCYKCHSAEKVKGDLRLDNKDMIFRGGKSGPLFVSGNPDKSELYRRITLPSGHKDVMPSKGKKLSQSDIDVLKFWISKGAPWPDESDKEKTFRVASLEPRNPALPPAVNNLDNPIDLWVNDYFKKNDISWPIVVDDRIFLRRIYLDIIGLMPSPEELEAFSKDPRPDKRGLWIRQLLERNDDYAIHWLTFWNDALRNDYSGTGYIDEGGRFGITDWLYKSLRDNKPYDVFVRELISPTDVSKGFIKGIRWRGVVNASQTIEIQAAQNVAQVFLGLNLKCASCHNSFINNWKLEDAYAFANIFSDSSMEINRCDKPTGKFTEARILWKELGEINDKAPSAVKQQQLAESITKPADGRLYRTIVNRIWAQMMGRGLVEPVDVMDNEPWSQDLLDWIASNFVERRFNLKDLIYQIATSRTYQLPSIGVKDANSLASHEFKFTGMVRRRMSAEQFSDVVGNVVWPLFGDSVVKYNPFGAMVTHKEYSWKKVLENPRTQEPGSFIYRAALVENNGFLAALGRPNRETVSTGRESQANLLQALELTNGENFSRALKKGAERWKGKYSRANELVIALYRSALLRDPQPKELQIAVQALGNPVSVEAVDDLLWALVLLPEFQLIY